MVKVVDECVHCGLPCLGDACSNRNIRVHVCDRCEEYIDTDQIYKDEDYEELCKECLLELHEKKEV